MTRRPPTQPTGNRQQDYAMREVAAVFESKARPGDSPMASGRFLLGLEFSSGGSLKYAHGLRRKPAGWFVVRSYGEGVDLLVETAADKNTISLAHSAGSGLGCKVDVWIF